jgi:hypothetical protein
MTERTTVRLPAELLRRAKRKAAAEGRTLTSLMEDGLRHVVSEQPPAEKRERIMPRISSAKGGLRPGVDITSYSALEELDDVERYGQSNRDK